MLAHKPSATTVLVVVTASLSLSLSPEPLFITPISPPLSFLLYTLSIHLTLSLSRFIISLYLPLSLAAPAAIRRRFTQVTTL